MGIYVYEPKVIKYIKHNVYLNVNTLVKTLIKDDRRVFGYLSEGSYYWIDMGQHGDYIKANEEFEKRREEFLPK
jgi:NDP-sugar pyrophosphorylase family protein